MQDEHQKAALRAKRSAMSKRRQIEEAKQAIKWKEEEFELEVEINTVDEQRKVLQKFEAELEVDASAQAAQTTSVVNVPAPTDPSQVVYAPVAVPVPTVETPGEIPPPSQHVAIPTQAAEASAEIPSATQDNSAFNRMTESSLSTGLRHGLNVGARCFTPNDTVTQDQQLTVQDSSMMHRPIDLSVLFAEQRRGQLPVLEPEVFQGSVEKFHPWVKALESFIESRTSTLHVHVNWRRSEGGD